ncbi:hypothetical protein [Polynucleobacter asymbioticus]|uniref:DUF4239 domain-containing protein n=1 Tax=Polynucleobacter asymbioticus TaxID=576611 RepID=A0AAC9IW47_9BURK|nr:hypothetical protein [Polynucleobacter asymbioticus]APB99938.1 hypothetical protein A4F89_11640 [Polynucleobacter asymbioticus]APC02241.1 hypothetical protein AOC25_11770 [Polynucleobacter asymbioticus]
MIESLLNLSLPLLIFGVFVVLVVSSELGFWIGRLALKIVSKNAPHYFDNSDENVSTITNSSLALLALFLGFTFSSAMDHFELNRQAVINEAAVIKTAYQAAKLQPAPYSQELVKDIREYADIRLELESTQSNEKSVREIQSKSQHQLEKIWSQLRAIAQKDPQSGSLDLLFQAIDSVGTAENARTEYLLNNVPNGLFVPVGLFLIFNGVLLGASLGEGSKRHIILSWGLYFLVALAVGIIADLDRPLHGFINVDQQAMRIMRSAIH